MASDNNDDDDNDDDDYERGFEETYIESDLAYILFGAKAILRDIYKLYSDRSLDNKITY